MAQVRRFGVMYYIGVGFNHQMPPLALGPHCTVCKQDYNYPCAWSNAQSLVGHVQALMFMISRHTIEEALGLVTNAPEYGGGGGVGRANTATKDWLYAFIYDFNGTARLEPLPSATMNPHTWP